MAVCLVPAPVWAAPQDEEQPTQLQSDQEKGQAALAEAREHFNAGRWPDAIRAYEQVLRYLPGNEEAVEGLRQAEIYMNRGTTIDEVEQERRVLKQQAEVEFEEAMKRSRELLEQQDFDGAQRFAVTAQVKLDQNKSRFSEGEFTTLRQRAEAQIAEVSKQRETSRLIEEEEKRIREIDQQRLERKREEAKRQQEINERLRRVRQLQMEEKYEEALQVIDEILFLDPLHPTALLIKDMLETTAIYKEYVEIQRRKEMAYSIQPLQNQERMIPPTRNITGPGKRGVSDLMQYPEDWSQISIMRYNESGFHDTVEDREVAQRLASTSVPIDFTANTFEQVLNFFEQVSGVTIYVDWKALNLIGVDREAEITLQLDEVSVSTALARVMEQLGEDEDLRPQYAIQDGMLTISSDEALRKRVEIVVYDIRDLLFEVPYFDNAPDLDLSSALGQGGGGGYGGGGGGGGSGGGGGGGYGGGGGSLFGDPGSEADRLTRQELVEQIVNIIQENVDPNGWRELGGEPGSLQELNGNLIITNTPRNHRLIEGLLAQLRQIRALQINVETRVLNVSTDWFERIGVDLDLYFNTNNDFYNQAKLVDPLAHLSDVFNVDGTLKDPLVYDVPNLNADGTVPPVSVATGMAFRDRNLAAPWGSMFGIPNATATGIQYLIGPTGSPIRTTQGFAPIGVSQGSLSLLDAAGVGLTTSFGTAVLEAGPALVTGVQFLDDIQVDLLIEATQADRRSVILTAPRITFFNGQRAWVAITTQSHFVSGLQAITGDASGAFQPIINRLSEGFKLDVEAVISSDRRYVTITVLFDQAEVIRLEETASFTGAAGGGGGGAGGGGQAAVFQGTIQLPVLEGSYIRTTVSVPDKGTVLLGGQRSVQEFEVETGVPILSKIPFINRFFTNRMTSKEEQTLLILIRPEIIIQQENEGILFPGLSDTIGAGAASYLR